MTSAAEWVQGARPRTLGAAISPVLVGTAAAYADAERVIWWRAGAALVVALALQVGVNYANDYSDGVRGADADRVGPLRLTASRVAAPAAVRNAALIAFAVAAAAGLALAIAVDLRLLVVGVVAIAAAALYTGGPRPYGYSGLGELSVLVFFGVVATAGSAYVQLERVPATAWWGSLAVGLLACAILLANNIRDVDTDRAAGKRTLAVRIGARRARALFVGCVAGAFVAVAAIGVLEPTALIALAAVPLAVPPVRLVMTRSDPPSLVAALVGTARVQLVVAVLLTVGFVTS
ncbi:MAG: 1,4-dihydroxy-2-naphthoate polyprenyltransferase [Actinomycetota bacterium]|jgi:1,4-dihydroxy-2-naphthoate octaprenyltransferase|nr:1,4-dihydroxy-2-naphthoate polyprenyltransferase [Actinomycetota bacterium]